MPVRIALPDSKGVAGPRTAGKAPKQDNAAIVLRIHVKEEESLDGPLFAVQAR